MICVADVVIDIPGPDTDALWLAGLCWRRVIRFDAFLGGLARLCSRLPWSRSPSTHTKLPAEPEGVTCADARGPAVTILDIPENASAPGDAPPLRFAERLATFIRSLVRLRRPPPWSRLPPPPLVPSVELVEVSYGNDDAVLDIPEPSAPPDPPTRLAPQPCALGSLLRRLLSWERSPSEHAGFAAPDDTHCVDGLDTSEDTHKVGGGGGTASAATSNHPGPD